jgi:hypothetical protein
VDELTRDGQPAPILIVDESAGWESGPCPDVDDDGADAAEQLAELQRMVDRALARRAGGAVQQWAREHGPSPSRPRCGLFVYYSGRGGRVPSPCYLDPGHPGECAAS